MWPKLAVAGALLLLQSAAANNCLYTVSVLDVTGVQCVSSYPCSGTYYASGLSQGVGACPTSTACALLPETPIMGCAAAGRTDLIYVNADGTLTKDGKTVTLSGASSSTSSTTSSSSKSKTRSSSTRSSNASSGSGSITGDSDGGSDAHNATTSSKSTTSANNSSWSSESASGSYTISPGSSSANQQAKFNPGSILSDGSNASNSSSSDGLGLGSIIAIVVGCLAVVAVAAGARLLKKGKDAELSTPGGAVAMEGYNNGGGGGGMTPKENVLLL